MAKRSVELTAEEKGDLYETTGPLLESLYQEWLIDSAQQA